MTMVAHRRKYLKFHPLAELPKLSNTLVTLNNLLVGKSQRLHFTVDQDYSHQLKFIPWINESKKDYRFNLSLDLGGSAAMLWLSDWPLKQRMHDYVTEDKYQRIPEELMTAFMEVVLEPFLHPLEEYLETTIRIGRLAAKKTRTAPSLWIGFELQETHHETESIKDIRGMMCLDERFLSALQRSLETWPQLEKSPWEQHHTPVWPELASITFTRSELQSIESNDIILLGLPATSDEIIYPRLRFASNLYCDAELEENYLSILKIGVNMSDETQNEENNILNLDDIPVNLTFDLGEETLPFQELKTLMPGYTFELHRPYKEAVQIRSQNRLMGKGELVDVNGQIGVRITSIFNSK